LGGGLKLQLKIAAHLRILPFLFLSFLTEGEFFGGFAYAESMCNESCADASDCSEAGCPVCLGTCVSCRELGDSGSCADTGTGASDHCFWSAGECLDVADVPELPGQLISFLLLAAGWIAFHFARKSHR